MSGARWVPIEVKKEYAEKAYKLKQENPSMPFRNIAFRMGISEGSLKRWVHKFVDPEFKHGHKGLTYGYEYQR